MNRNRLGVALGFIVLSTVFFGPLVQACTKLVSGEFPLVQIIWLRAAGYMIWMLIFFWRGHGLRMFSTQHLGIQLARSSLLFLSSILWILAIPSVSLATAGIIGFTAPIMVVMLSVPLLGERVGIHRWAAVLTGFAGALLVLRPGSTGLGIETLLLFGTAASFALYQILTRRISHTDSAAANATYTIIVQLLVTSVLLPFDFRLPSADETSAWLAFSGLFFLGGFRHFFIVKAYEYAPASFISPFFYMELVGVTAMGLLIFGEFPDAWTWTGGGIIMLSGLYIAHREALNRRNAGPSS
ncbi:MAG: drug/metabolite transporter (DMT)-like permease [Gammaproteobacteria bacterium]|jgi:drug/metabolite transporter (DMT)-like permease